MGKRKHLNSEDYSYIKKKIKKLEKKLKRSRRQRSDSSSSSESQNSIALPPNSEGGSPAEFQLIDEIEDVVTEYPNDEGDIQTCISEREPSPSPLVSNTTAPSPSAEPQPSTSKIVEKVATDNAILEMLGEDPSISKTYGSEINSDLATRLQHIAVHGLSKDSRKELQNKYLPPSNCTLIDAPTLNSEVRAAVSETVLKRDKGIELKQKQLGCAVSCIGEAISILLKREHKDTDFIKLLMDAGRLMCDVQNSDSMTRRNFVMFNLKKDMRDQLQKTKIDGTLFGAQLAETIKTAKIINKSGIELKSTQNFKRNSKFTKQPPPVNHNKNLNWRAPPQTRRQRGPQEQKEPAQRNPPASSSRPSYRVPPPMKNRNRR